MNKIKPIIFRITKDEIQSMFSEMRRDSLVNESSKLTDKQIKNILDYVECDEFLAKDIRMSIKSAIEDVA